MSNYCQIICTSKKGLTMQSMLSYGTMLFFNNYQSSKQMEKQKQVNSLAPAFSNHPIPLSSLNKWYEGYTFCDKGSYLPYNHQYQDFGWGCAWRVIQLLLSTRAIVMDFKELLQNYGTKQRLMKIAKIIDEFKRFESCLVTDKWAPQQNTNYWAEPLIGKLILKDRGFDSKLYLVNGYPEAYAPQYVFDSTLSFKQFVSLIKSSLPHSPVMLDDSKYTITIVGFKIANQNMVNQKQFRISLIVADPHISNNRQSQKIGIYQVILDSQGNRISDDVKEIQQNFYPFSCHKKVFFKDKKWMALVIQ